MAITIDIEIGQIVPVLHQEDSDDSFEEFYHVSFLQPVELTKEEYLELLRLTKEHRVRIEVKEVV